MEALRPGATQESELPVYSREEETRKSGTPLGPDTRARPTPARRDPEADRDLLDASSEGNMAAVKRILEAGRADINCRDVVGLSLHVMDINSRGRRSRTPVMEAARRGHRDVVELLVSEGADVSLVDKGGDIILHFACMRGDVETVKYVLSLHVVDINSRGAGSWTPVMWAVVRGHRDVVELLVSEGADVSLVDEVGYSILHCACAAADVETVKCVLSLNVVDIDARNNAGRTAADMARLLGHQEVVKLL
ncbi:uncharacterized protein [Haliotis cracherodii]|uniref:uncharacterized protein n=1 Tax=Haliotis cracherodii TaxID=6455 RepID=UPI0039E974AF